MAAYRDALRQDPKLPDLHNNLGLALRQSGHLDEAAEALRRAAASSPQDAYGQSNLAGVLKELGRLDEAESLYRDVLRRHPDDAVAHYSLGLVLLLAGRLDEGWPEYEWRFQAGAMRVASLLRSHDGKGNRWPGARCWFVWSRGSAPISNSAVTPHRSAADA